MIKAAIYNEANASLQQFIVIVTQLLTLLKIEWSEMNEYK